MFRAVCDERGGVDGMTAVGLAVARALAVALTTDPLNPSTIAQLTGLLPPVAKATGGQIDLSKLDDAELDALEAMVTKAGTVPPPEPGSERAQINELLTMNETLQGIIAAREREADAARQGEETWRRLAESAGAECDRLREQLKVAEAAAWRRAAHPDPQPAAPGQAERQRPPNVVPLSRGSGNGSLPR
jgi:hypothetical protein